MKHFILSLAFAPLLLSATWLPAQSIDQDHTGSNTDAYPVEGAPLSQSFVAGVDGDLLTVNIDVAVPFCPFKPELDSFVFTLNILDGDGTDGINLAWQRCVVALPYERGLFAVNFATPAKLSAGSSYTFEIAPEPHQICDDDFSIGLGLSMYKSDDDTYPNGRAYTSLFGDPMEDVYFQTVMQGSPNEIEDVTVQSMSVRPNPANGVIFLDAVAGERLVQITNATGNVWLKKINQGMVIIDDLPPGVYFILGTFPFGVIRFIKL